MDVRTIHQMRPSPSFLAASGRKVRPEQPASHGIFSMIQSVLCIPERMACRLPAVATDVAGKCLASAPQLRYARRNGRSGALRVSVTPQEGVGASTPSPHTGAGAELGFAPVWLDDHFYWKAAAPRTTWRPGRCPRRPRTRDAARADRHPRHLQRLPEPGAREASGNRRRAVERPLDPRPRPGWFAEEADTVRIYSRASRRDWPSSTRRSCIQKLL